MSEQVSQLVSQLEEENEALKASCEALQQMLEAVTLPAIDNAEIAKRDPDFFLRQVYEHDKAEHEKARAHAAKLVKFIDRCGLRGEMEYFLFIEEEKAEGKPRKKPLSRWFFDWIWELSRRSSMRQRGRR